ncbi:MAG: electron transfer flavoprotein subunit alpha/FixB family protein [Geothrix sp.]|uniref:electron transfer flavoprotein subunit alpha/FixB family protein n=1 Tax=Geothrix sp. TaxID=1962974 RepID=UPI0017917714|nr:electron transfer flavoprotein subunit alpha/FixB family protein [Geothrix sp.]NWJ40035.1 electron transfer flavoprotein subunit alpha/FixB family protein [Geothrix sp.]WIL21956.1 MAG: electron transfer flavoprotein subunit alpha/FixB family protein [Geothrix sp.]
MILVFCELKDGQIRKPSAEALSEGRRLADAAGRQLGALFAGASCAGAAEAAKYGADLILTAEGATLASYSSDAFAAVIAEAMKAKGATVLLAAATAVGKDMAPRAAARLGAGYASDVTGLSIVDGKLQAVRPVYAGKAFATTSFASAIQVATTRPNVFAAAEKAGAGTMESLAAPAGDFKSVVKEILAKASGKVDLSEANVIVSGGRGMKDGANFKILEELADAIGGVVGASRAAVDAGWGLPHSMQVGQTGKVVSPTLYIACGISGAIQHIAGMSGSKFIVAINKDPEAPIFKLANYGIVGDLFEVVPELTKAAKALGIGSN